ncbi:CheY-P phosphatase CheX [Clostridium acetireducens DSM 10703]|uniref:CheY-P phosphatase CheX n=1 Tax=Clostridium acetireducens DSM 10703 TaxID=1121290 RepID=A0A1E8EYC0_9CLOT|nr:chemotaxis protein CheX [Clostridium acetireducens]OFI05947.1 CheY-P phosphatase CheX [Clostridium acetireducens DSM 10703]
MDVKYINPFMQSFINVMPQIGFTNVKKEGISMKDKNIESKGIAINVGIVGDIRGNIVYVMDEESGKKIASKMMMGFPVEELNEMAQSAISELTNMLTANASTNFFNEGININISTPTLIYGEEIQIKMNSNQVLCIQLSADDIPIEIDIAFDNISL